MKKFFIPILIISALLVTSCKNFLESSDFIADITKALEYANTDFAKVTITSLNSYTETVTPAVGNYNDSYKKGDEIELSLSIKSNYEFIEWKATPEGAIEFASASDLATTAVIKNIDSTIVIEPVVCERPTVTVFPISGSEVAKNTSIIIQFSHPLDITEEDLAKIKIENVVPENYCKPKMNEEKTVITIDADETNLIEVTSGLREITVTIPQDFYYLFGDHKINLEKSFTQTFSVNNETTKKLELTINNPNPDAGSLSLSGKYQFNIGQIQNIVFNLISNYSFNGWIVKDEKGKVLKDEDYKEYFTFNGSKKNTNINITIIKSGKTFVIEPSTTKYLNVTQTTPVYDSLGVFCSAPIKIFFDEDVDSVENLYWTYDELVAMGKEPQISFVAQIYDEKHGEFIRLAYEKDGKNNPIYVKEDDYKKYDITQLYYWAYLDDNNMLVNKNFNVSLADTDESLMSPYIFQSPYFQNGNVLVIFFRKMNYIDRIDSLPANSEIKVTISENFKSVNGAKLASDYEFYYKTNGVIDHDYPSGKIENIYGYTNIKPYEFTSDYKTILKATKKFPNADLTNSGFPTPQNSSIRRETELQAIKNAKTVDELLALNVKPVKSLAFIKGKIYDSTSDISFLTLELVPVESDAYKDNNATVISYSKTYFDKKEIDLSFQEDSFIFTIPEGTKNGVYEVFFYATDIYGNAARIKPPYSVYSGTENIITTTPYCLYDNTIDETLANLVPSNFGPGKVECAFDLPAGSFLFVPGQPPLHSKKDPNEIALVEVYEVLELLEQGYNGETILQESNPNDGYSDVRPEKVNCSFVTLTEPEEVSFSKFSPGLQYLIVTEDKLGNYYIHHYHLETGGVGWQVTRAINGKYTIKDLK